MTFPTDAILQGDALEVLRTLESESVDCCVTSPPYYGVRNYQHEGQYGLEATVCDYVEKMLLVFSEVRRILKPQGCFFLNIADSYSERGNSGGNNGLTVLQASAIREEGFRKNVGYKRKELMGVPHLVSEALRQEGWYRRDAIIWAKPNGMPGSQDDRCTSSYEFIFLFSKSARYWSDFDAIKTPPRESSQIRLAQDIQAQAGSHRANGGAKTNGTMKAVARKSDKQRGHTRKHAGFNDRWDLMSRSDQQSTPAMMRNVWFVAPAQSRDGHFAVMPDEIARRCILAGCPEGGIVLDPFLGSGTTAAVAKRLGRKFIGIELNEEYIRLAEKRIAGVTPSLFQEAS